MSSPRAASDRRGRCERATAETRVVATVALDGSGSSDISTGLGFLDHMLTTLSFHSSIDLEIATSGDLHVDDHHSVEDTALALGNALSAAIGDAAGVARFGWAFAPLDEALARAVVDVSRRPHAAVDLGLRRERLGDVSCENLPHFFGSLASAAGLTLHIDVLRGHNDHHRVEAAFKALALALRAAVAIGGPGIPSTKGVL
ncbi:MAG: imidazoleglycerol-phosphate dehydratase HisB [Gemmatimonadota bacterium]|nr:imidazoleglycerol-phosphate dehydratase HisB [Gemmatimonadota bacterium]